MIPILFPAIGAVSLPVVYAVRHVASPINIARTHRLEVDEATRREVLEHHVQFGADEADRAKDALACAQACASILHSRLLRDLLRDSTMELAAVEWAAYLGAWLGPTPILEHDDRMWLGLRFDIDAPAATIAACLAVSAGRARYEKYEAGDWLPAQQLTTVIELFDDKLLPLIPGGNLVGDLIQADRKTFAALEHKLAEPGSLLWATTEWAA